MRTWWSLISGALVFGALGWVACGGIAVIDASPGDGGAGGKSAPQGVGGMSPSTGSNATCSSAVPCCAERTGEEVDFLCDAAAMPFCPPGSRFSQDGSCGAKIPTPCFEITGCAREMWCDFPDNLCGTGQPGSCKPSPRSCPDLHALSCTCSGNLASNPCDGEVAGFDMNAAAGCPPQMDMFSCGYAYCRLGEQYCQRSVSDVVGGPDDFRCLGLPAVCAGGVDCGCASAEPCGFACVETGAGALTLTCPGG